MSNFQSKSFSGARRRMAEKLKDKKNPKPEVMRFAYVFLYDDTRVLVAKKCKRPNWFEDPFDRNRRTVPANMCELTYATGQYFCFFTGEGDTESGRRENDENQFVLPGGRINQGEDGATCAKREFFAETGMELSTDGEFINHGKYGYLRCRVTAAKLDELYNTISENLQSATAIKENLVQHIIPNSPPVTSSNELKSVDLKNFREEEIFIGKDSNWYTLIHDEMKTSIHDEMKNEG